MKTALIAIAGLAALLTAGAATAEDKTAGNKTPAKGVQVIGIGSQLGHVIAAKQEEVRKNQGEQETAKTDLNNWMEQLKNSPEVQHHIAAGENLRQRCPPGTSLPIDQANACNAEIDSFNAEDAAMLQQVNAKQAQVEAVIADKQRRIDALQAESAKLQGLLDSISSCTKQDTMATKACLDQLYDNASASASAYDLDPSVVKPGPFGTSQVSPEAAIKAYKQSGEKDPQLRKLNRKKVEPPPPGK